MKEVAQAIGIAVAFIAGATFIIPPTTWLLMKVLDEPAAWWFEYWLHR